MDLSQIIEGIELAQGGQIWLAAIVFAPLLLALLQVRSKWLTGWLPKAIQWLPATLIVALGAFVELASPDVSPLAVVVGVVMTVLGGSSSVGLYHAAKRTPLRKLGAVVPLALLLSAPAYQGCGAPMSQTVPQVADWAIENPGAVIGAVEAVLENFETMRDLYGAFAPNEFEQAQALVEQAREKLDEARGLERQGREFLGQVQRLTEEAAALVERAKAFLSRAGLVSDDGARFLRPVGGRSVAGPESLDAALPPELQ